MDNNTEETPSSLPHMIELPIGDDSNIPLHGAQSPQGSREKAGGSSNENIYI